MHFTMSSKEYAVNVAHSKLWWYSDTIIRMKVRTIEIEFRALIDYSKRGDLIKFLRRAGIDLGEDNKRVFFIEAPGKIIKVEHNTSRNSGKLVLKLNYIGNGSSFEEIEVPISPGAVPRVLEILSHLGFDQVQDTYQIRHNFEYGGVQIAIKYSPDWGHHVELEIVIHDNIMRTEAEARIRSVAEDLGLQLMSDDELAAFVDDINRRHRQRRDTTRRLT